MVIKVDLDQLKPWIMSAINQLIHHNVLITFHMTIN